MKSFRSRLQSWTPMEAAQRWVDSTVPFGKSTGVQTCWSATCCVCGKTYISAIRKIAKNYHLKAGRWKYPDAYRCWGCGGPG